MTRKNLAVVLVFCLLLACFSACQSEQDEIYSQAVEDQKSAVSAAPTAEPGDGAVSYTHLDVYKRQVSMYCMIEKYQALANSYSV